MGKSKARDNVENILSDMDHLIGEIIELRQRVKQLVATEHHSGHTQDVRSVRDTAWFGVWAARDDMQGLSSREWLTHLRNQQWGADAGETS